MIHTQQEQPDCPAVKGAHLTLAVAGKPVKLDAEGYLIDPAEWCVAVTEQLAENDNLLLTTDHWLLIGFLHRFYQEYRLVPELPTIVSQLCGTLPNCRWKRNYIHKLFPGGIKTACRYAGIPAPVRLGRI